MEIQPAVSSLEISLYIVLQSQNPSQLLLKCKQYHVENKHDAESTYQQDLCNTECKETTYDTILEHATVNNNWFNFSCPEIYFQ